MAISCQLPILPVVFSQYYFLNKKQKRFDHGKILITALPPIPTDGMNVKQVDELMKRVHELMTTQFHESNKEIQNFIKNTPNY